MESEEQPENRREWAASALTMQVKRVCESCNTGWMSNLEGHARRVLSPMIHGQRTPLGRADQEMICRWLVKTAAMFGYAWVLEQTPHPEHLRSLFEDKATPDNCFAWLAAYAGPKVVWVKSHRLELVRPSAMATVMDGELFTVQLGDLVMQLLWVVPNVRNVRPEIPLEVWAFVLDLWPRTAGLVIWPPEKSLDDEALYRYGTSFLPRASH